jgi:hypothetical protein
MRRSTVRFLTDPKVAGTFHVPSAGGLEVHLIKSGKRHMECAYDTRPPAADAMDLDGIDLIDGIDGIDRGHC